MDAFAWFWLTVIVGIITIGVNDALCTYWKSVKDESGKRHIISGFSKNE